MKFIRQEKIITTIFDKEVTDSSVIRINLEELKKQHVTFSLSIKKHFSGDDSSRIISYDKAVVKIIREFDVDFSIFGKHGVILMKGISFQDIVEVRIVEDKNDVLKYGKEITKFDVMDI